MRYSLPPSVMEVIAALNQGGFEAFIVGGCVRDLILGRAPKDWDVTTNATPEKILALFPESFYENDFGTVGIKVPRFVETTDSVARTNDIIEVTTYRTESHYEDRRRPNTVNFSLSLQEDLARRDFTINAIAYGPTKTGKWEIIDPFNGQADLKDKIIRTVGNPEERLNEDALRLMRAIRFYAELRNPKETKPTHNWQIDAKTLAAIKKLSDTLEVISQERIRDELV